MVDNHDTTVTAAPEQGEPIHYEVPEVGEQVEQLPDRGTPFDIGRRETAQRIPLNNEGGWLDVVIKPNYGRLNRFKKFLINSTTDPDLSWISNFEFVYIVYFSHAYYGGELSLDDLEAAFEILETMLPDEMEVIQEAMDQYINPLLERLLNRTPKGFLSQSKASAAPASASNGSLSS